MWNRKIMIISVVALSLFNLCAFHSPWLEDNVNKKIKVGGDFTKINSESDVYDFCGHLVAYKTRSGEGYFSAVGENFIINQDSSVNYGFVEFGIYGNPEQLLSVLKEKSVPSTSFLIDEKILEASLSMRLLTDEEVAAVYKALFCGKAKLEYFKKGKAESYVFCSLEREKRNILNKEKEEFEKQQEKTKIEINQ